MTPNDSSMDSIQKRQTPAPERESDVEKHAGVTEPSKPEDESAVAEPEQPYSTFSKREKKLITFIASLTTLFPPLTGSMYYPIITELAGDLKVSITKINLTITMYLVWFLAIFFYWLLLTHTVTDFPRPCAVFYRQFFR